MEYEADHLLAVRLKRLRQEKAWSLDDLAEKSGVSRASLSRLENADVSPTAQVLGKLCAAYGLTTSRLLYMVEQDAPLKLAAAQQPVWVDRKSGFTRRSISPPAPGFVGEVVRCELKPGAIITYEKLPREGLEHHIHLLEGALTFSVNGQSYELSPGDSLRVKLYGETRFETPAHSGATYFIFVV